MVCEKCGSKMHTWNSDETGEKVYLCTNCHAAYDLDGKEKTENNGDEITVKFKFKVGDTVGYRGTLGKVISRKYFEDYHSGRKLYEVKSGQSGIMVTFQESELEEVN